jgi:hypothetical protein
MLSKKLQTNTDAAFSGNSRAVVESETNYLLREMLFIVFDRSGSVRFSKMGYGEIIILVWWLNR